MDSTTQNQTLSAANAASSGLPQRPKMQPLYVNPICGLPRNSPCPCASGKKFKKCCLSKVPRAVTKEGLRAANEIVEQHRQLCERSGK
jgi:hypothetical protein